MIPVRLGRTEHKPLRLGQDGRVFRYDGDEFTLIFPGKSFEETVDHLVHIRKSVKQGGFVVRGA